MAKEMNFNVNEKAVFWQTVNSCKCFICSSPDHIAKLYPKNTKIYRNPYEPLYEHFRPAQYRPKLTVPIKILNNRIQFPNSESNIPQSYAAAAKPTFHHDPRNFSMHEASESYSSNILLNCMDNNTNRNKAFGHHIVEFTDNVKESALCSNNTKRPKGTAMHHVEKLVIRDHRWPSKSR